MAYLPILLKLKWLNSVCKRVIHGLKANCVMLSLPTLATLYDHIMLVVKSLFQCGARSNIQQTDLIIRFWSGSGEKKNKTPQSLRGGSSQPPASQTAWHDPFYQMQLYKYGCGSRRAHSPVGWNSMLVKTIISPNVNKKKWLLFKRTDYSIPVAKLKVSLLWSCSLLSCLIGLK